MPIGKARKAKDPNRTLAEQLLARLEAKREEDVKAASATCFDLEYDTTHDHDQGQGPGCARPDQRLPRNASSRAG